MNKKNNRFTRPKKTRYFGFILAGMIAALCSAILYTGVQYFFVAKSSVTENPAIAQGEKQDKKKEGGTEATSTGNDTLGQEGILLRKTAASFRQIAKKIGPAVVNIKSTRGLDKKKGITKFHRGGPSRRSPMPDDNEESPFGGGGGDPLYEFFERFSPFFNMPEQSPQISLGSGIIIDKTGIVVTNNHVVGEKTSEILVSLQGEKTDLKAKVLGLDPRTDLAVLKIEANRSFPYAEWADSDSEEVGDWAIAIGSPFALGQSVTVGIISAKGGRNSTLTGAEYASDIIQTDAAINPGNSGGPLCNLEGKVMGVNTAIYTRSGGYMGIGFAIPSNLAKEVVSKLLKDGKIVRGWLGVLIQPLDPEIAKEIGIKEGVGIHQVVEGSPAATAGIKAGDVVIEVEGKEMKEVNQLQKTISGFKPGQSVKIKVIGYQDKSPRTVTVKIGELPTEDTLAAAGGSGGGGDTSEPDQKLGLVVTPAKGKSGVVIVAVAPGSLGQQVGLTKGDIILSINREKIHSPAAYKKAAEKAKHFSLLINRKGQEMFFQFSAQ